MLAPHLNAFGTAAVSIRTPANRCKKSIYNLGFRARLAGRSMAGAALYELIQQKPGQPLLIVANNSAVM
jgi:hypothetical protein